MTIEDDEYEDLTTWVLQAVSDDGETCTLGSRQVPSWVGRPIVMEMLMEQLWDSRLDSASCRPNLIEI
jgi:hypothetical protein